MKQAIAGYFADGGEARDEGGLGGMFFRGGHKERIGEDKGRRYWPDGQPAYAPEELRRGKRRKAGGKFTRLKLLLDQVAERLAFDGIGHEGGGGLRDGTAGALEGNARQPIVLDLDVKREAIAAERVVALRHARRVIHRTFGTDAAAAAAPIPSCGGRS